MKSLIIVPILFLQLTVFTISAQNASYLYENLIDEVLLNDYKAFYSTKDLDKRFIKYLKSKKEFDTQMVNPGELFNETDMVIEKFPRTRLILFGKGSKQTNFILYEGGGGNASFTYGLIYRKYKNYYDYVVMRTDKLYDVEKFKEAISKKQYEIM